MEFLICSVVCLALLIAINWYAGDDLKFSDFVYIAIVSIIPIVNIFIVAVFLCALATDNGIKREVIILKGRGK
jgi:hypothetical protein